ncbi:MAG: AAA family ATPase [Methylocystis sp.]
MTLAPEQLTSIENELLQSAERAILKIKLINESIGKIIFGQEEVIEQVLVTVLSGGHGLLVGLPGLAKTKLVETLGATLGLAQQRIQFTPDLMPADIIGSEILEETPDKSRVFRFIKGPIFGQLLMADEINRASPRTQSALLQAMQEHHVTVAGEHYELPTPFHVLATQNPLEQEGTYPLPEAQLDRFLMQINVSYPDWKSERRILIETTGDKSLRATNCVSSEELILIQRLVRQLPVGDKVVDAILHLIRSARPGEGHKDISRHIAWGPGPRGAQSLMLAARARALLTGRLSPTIEDVAILALPVLRHRMALTSSSRRDVTIEEIIKNLVNRIE